MSAVLSLKPIKPAHKQFAERRHQLKSAHHEKLASLAQDALSVAEAAKRVAQAAAEAAHEHHHLNVATQMHFLTGALMRMVKDVGVIEHLQKYASTGNGK